MKNIIDISIYIMDKVTFFIFSMCVIFSPFFYIWGVVELFMSAGSLSITVGIILTLFSPIALIIWVFLVAGICNTTVKD